MHIAIVTAGGAGMFCGSCMHDNTWARALQAHGCEVSLIPTYTPIRVDEQNISTSQVFFGGINVYLEHRFPFWQKLPRGLVRWLDSPWMINLATRCAVSNDAHNLGPLTIAMLEGELGPQKRDVDQLAHFLSRQLRPDVVCFSNILLVGTVRRLREQFDGKLFCTLQGDDIFLKDLPQPYAERAVEMINERARDFDGFLVHSRYYRDFMSDYLGLPEEKFHIVPLGIDLDGHDGLPDAQRNGQFTVGYFARICNEKGLHQLVEAFEILHGKHPDVRLRVGGYLGRRDRKYFRDIQRKAAAFGPAFEYIGSPETRAEKVAFYKSLDVLSVPTVYHEPKGLYVLEALANGVAVVQPEHGAFPELIETTGGGLLVAPGKAEALAAALESLMQDPARRLELATTGHKYVHARLGPKVLAEATVTIFTETPSRTVPQEVLGEVDLHT